jgi:ABC-type polysaccharide/polyol phosphate export permease
MFKDKLSNGTQFAPYLLAGVLTITFFNQSFLQAAEAIANGSGIFLKIKVAPQVFALASSITNAANFSVGIIPLLLVSSISNSPLSVYSPLILIVISALIFFTTGLGLIFGILFIRFNDVKFIVTVLLQLVTYLTPVFYPKEILSGNVRLLVSLNPLTSYLDVFRNLFNGTEIATLFDWVYMLGSSTIIFLLGLYLFNKNWKKVVVMM